MESSDGIAPSVSFKVSDAYKIVYWVRLGIEFMLTVIGISTIVFLAYNMVWALATPFLLLGLCLYQIKKVEKGIVLKWGPQK